MSDNNLENPTPILFLLLVATTIAMGSLIWAHWTWTREVRLDMVTLTVIAALIPPAVAASLGLIRPPMWLRLPLLVLAALTVRPVAALVLWLRSHRNKEG